MEANITLKQLQDLKRKANSETYKAKRMLRAYERQRVRYKKLQKQYKQLAIEYYGEQNG